VRAVHHRSVPRGHVVRRHGGVHPQARGLDAHRGGQRDAPDRRGVRHAGRALGPGQLCLGPAGLHAGYRAYVHVVELPDDVRQSPRLGPGEFPDGIPPRADGERRRSDERGRYLARRVWRVSPRPTGAPHRRLPAAIRGRCGELPPRQYRAASDDHQNTMRRRAKTSSTVVVLGSVFACSLAAQSEGSALAALPGSTRSAGLGGAGVALVGDAGAVFANPAGLAPIRHLALEGSYEPYLAGTSITTAALGMRLGHFTWGVGAQALDYGSEPVIVPDSASGGRRGTPTGATFTAADLLGVASIVYRRGFIAAGVSTKYARQQIGGYAADAWGGDVGLAMAAFDIFALGVSVQNLGGDFANGARLPRRTRIGVTMNYVDPQRSFR